MKMKLNDKNIEFNIFDMNHAQRFEDALEEMEKDEKAIQLSLEKFQNGEIGVAVFLGKNIDMFKKFFQTTTGVDVVGDCTDYIKIKKMYDDFLTELKKDKQKFARFSSKRIN